MVYALVKRVANEVGVVGVLRTKANGREIKVCVAQPTQVRLAIRGSLFPRCVGNALISVVWAATRQSKDASDSNLADSLCEFPACDLHGGMTLSRTVILRPPVADLAGESAGSRSQVVHSQ